MASLQTLITLILQQYFNTSLCLINVADNSDHNILNNISKTLYSINSNQVNHQIPQCQDFFLNINQTVAVIENIERFIRENTTYSYNTRKYLILLNGDDEIGVLFKKNVFTFIANALLIKPVGQNKSEDEIYNLYAHNYKELRGDNEAILLNKWFASNGSFLWDNIDLYPNRAWKLSGRPFVNAFVNNPPYIDISSRFRLGSEYNAMKEFAKYYNMTFVDLNLKMWGDFTDNWNATPNSVKALFIADEVDVYYSSALLTTPSLRYASLSHPYMRLSFKCLVPEPKVENDWLLALNIKSVKFWLLLLTSYTAFAVLIFGKKHLSSENWTFNKLEFFGITLSQAISVRDLPTNTLMRFMFVELFLLAIIFATIYNSHMCSIITIPNYVGRINTINDMIKQNLRWTAPTQGYAIPLEEYNKELHELFFLSTRPDILTYLRHEAHIGFAFIELTSRYYDLTNLNIPEIEHYNVLRDDFIVDFSYFHLRKNSALLEAMNAFLLHVTESGIHVHWETESYYARNLLLSYARLKDNDGKVRHPLNLDILKGHFVVWFAGIFIAACRFFYELCVVPK